MSNLKTSHGMRRVGAAACLVLALAGCGDKDSKAAEPQSSGAGKPAPDKVEPAKGAAANAGQAQQAPAAEAAAPSVATMNDIKVSQPEIEQVLRALPPPQRQQMVSDRALLERALRGLLSEKALVSQARNQNWQDRPEVRRAIRAAQDQVILRSYLDSVSLPPDSYPSDAELLAAYEQNKASFTQPAAYRLSQIFLAAPYSNSDAVTAARKKADDLIKRARAGKTDFAQLVKEASQDKDSAARNGDTGFVTLQQLVPELRDVVQHLHKGDVSDVVQMPTGLHILKLVDVRESRTLPISEVKDRLREVLRAQRQQQAAQAYMEGLVNAGTVSIDGKALQSALDAVK